MPDDYTLGTFETVEAGGAESYSESMSGPDGKTRVGGGVSYNSISCPCSSHAIDLGDGRIGCERDYFGEIQSVKSIPISNHLIDNNSPKVGDKWLCTNFKCGQGDF